MSTGFIIITLLWCVSVIHGCQINQCIILPGLCPGQMCVQDPATCQIICCDTASTVESCLNPTTTVAADAPDPSTSCPGGLECIHGFCNQSDGSENCVCNEGWLAGDCRTPSPDASTSTTPSRSTPPQTRENNVCNSSFYEPPAKSEHECFLPCVYGVCRMVGGAFSCECDPGADGVMCQHKCCLDCNGRGNCLYNSLTGEPVCSCLSNYTGPDCSIPISAPQDTSSPPQDNSTPTAPPQPTLPQQTPPPQTRERNVCNSSYYEPPAKSEHECFLPCLYGVCRLVGGAAACDCDPGADGLMCQHKCCLDCNGRGDCLYNALTGETLCNCLGNFTGPDCMDIKTTRE